MRGIKKERHCPKKSTAHILFTCWHAYILPHAYYLNKPFILKGERDSGHRYLYADFRNKAEALSYGPDFANERESEQIRVHLNQAAY